MASVKALDKDGLFVCLFVCLELFVPLENFSLIWRRHHCLWRAANIDLCSVLTAIEQWGFFSVPHLMWHGASVYNGHLRGPVTLTPIAERLAVELSLPVLTTGLSRLRFEHQTFRLRGERSNPLRHSRDWSGDRRNSVYSCIGRNGPLLKNPNNTTLYDIFFIKTTEGQMPKQVFFTMLIISIHKISTTEKPSTLRLTSCQRTLVFSMIYNSW